MSYDPMKIAKQAERDINSEQNRKGNRMHAGESSMSLIIYPLFLVFHLRF